MSSATHMEIGAARLERAADLAGQSFAFDYDEDAGAQAQRGGDRAWRWLAFFMGVFVFALATLTAG